MRSYDHNLLFLSDSMSQKSCGSYCQSSFSSPDHILVDLMTHNPNLKSYFTFKKPLYKTFLIDAQYVRCFRKKLPHIWFPFFGNLYKPKNVWFIITFYLVNCLGYFNVANGQKSLFDLFPDVSTTVNSEVSEATISTAQIKETRTDHS